MKLSNLKSVLILIGFVFSFHSSARVLGQFVGDVQKAAKEAGSDISWETCEDGSGGFNPEHVHSVVETGNTNHCDTNDSLVNKYKNNFVSISGLSKNGNYAITAGFLIDGCSKVMTTGHVFYEADQKTKLKDLQFYHHSTKTIYKLNNPVLREGPWKETTLYKDEVSYIETSRNPKMCSSAPMLADSNEVKDLSTVDKMDFYILRLNEKKQLCAQKCKILSTGVQHVTAEAYTQGSIEHDCNTKEGDSGSPVFAKTVKGGEYFVGMHTGPNPNKQKVNLFAPIGITLIRSLAATSVSK